MPTVDADAHVLEGPHSWVFMEGPFAPQVILRGGKEYWQIGSESFPKDVNVGAGTDARARDMRDIGARLKHMDALGIDIQVLYPTMFLRPWTREPAIERAVCRGYNRWLADIWRKGGGRLRWVAMLAFRTPSCWREELAFAKEYGACGIFMRGHEIDRRLTDPYFHPLFALAGEFDLPVCIHSASGSHLVSDFFGEDNFNKFKLAVVGSCHALLIEGVPALFPKVRWAFIEVSAQWIPYVVNDLSLRFKRRGRELSKRALSGNSIYVACQATDDLPYVLASAGEDCLVVGTDYGHADTATQIEALRLVRENRDIPQQAAEKMLCANPARLYGI